VSGLRRVVQVLLSLRVSAMTDIVRAPWTPSQIKALDKHQQRLDIHPYTCANRSQPLHNGDGLLCPGPSGWHCHACDYTQDWAHRTDTEYRP
jgi:hypothetical protein